MFLHYSLDFGDVVFLTPCGFTCIFQQLISSLHDICQYLCAHARLGSSHARLGSQKLEFSGVTADWGGTEGIGKLKTKLKVLNESVALYEKR